MKFNITQEKLNKALSVVSKIITGKNNLPIYNGVLIEAKQDKILFESSEIDSSIRYSVPGLIKEEGKCVLPANLFLNIVKSLSDSAVEISTNNKYANLRCDSTNIKLLVLSAEDFPKFPEFKVQDSIRLPFNIFSEMVKKVIKSVSKNESKPIMNGVYFESKKDYFRMVSTDSYRLSIVNAKKIEDSSSFSAIIQSRFLNNIIGLEETEKNINININQNQIMFKYGNGVYINRKIEGKYPNYNALIPYTFMTEAKIETKSLLDAIRRVILLDIDSDVKTKKVNLQFNTEDNSLTVYGSYKSGKAQEIIEAEVAGENLTICFNADYLKDSLSVIEEDKILFKLQNEVKPSILKLENSDDYLYLTMPIK